LTIDYNKRWDVNTRSEIKLHLNGTNFWQSTLIGRAKNVHFALLFVHRMTQKGAVGLGQNSQG